MTTKQTKFTITDGRGFQMTFHNGWTVSVQFGPFNYCANKSYDYERPGVYRGEEYTCVNAEIAAWDANGKWYHFEEQSDDVKGYCGTEEVGAFIAMIQSKEA